jgi:hypothetical protein
MLLFADNVDDSESDKMVNKGKHKARNMHMYLAQMMSMKMI